VQSDSAPGSGRVRVALAVPELSRGGADNVQGGPEGVFATLLQRIDRSRFEPVLIVNDATTCNLLGEIGDTQVISLGWTGRGLGWRPRLWARYPVPELVRAVRALQPDVLLTTLRMDVTAALAKPLFPRQTALVSRICVNISGARETQQRSAGRVRICGGDVLRRSVIARADWLVAQSESVARDIALHARDEDPESRTPGRSRWARMRGSTASRPSPAPVDNGRSSSSLEGLRRIAAGIRARAGNAPQRGAMDRGGRIGPSSAPAPGRGPRDFRQRDLRWLRRESGAVPTSS
jgi:hypothetical protein